MRYARLHPIFEPRYMRINLISQASYSNIFYLMARRGIDREIHAGVMS
jgi:hypothetical protein